MRNLLESFQKTQNKKIDNLCRDIQEVKANTSEINNTNQDIGTSLDFMTDQLKNLQTKIDGLEGQKKEIQSQILKVDEKCEFLEKSLKKTSIEIRYLPRKVNENKETLFNYINCLAKNLEIILQPGDLRDVYRIPNKKDSSKSTIAVELSSTLMKHSFINAARKFNKTKKLNVGHLGIKDNSSPLFLSEILTSKTRRLHFLARDFARQEKYQFCWTSNGNVYLKKQEGAPYILVKNEAQLCGPQS